MSSIPHTSATPEGVPPPFDPVPVRPRHDGWTPERQMAFIAALAATGCVTQACASVGMSPRAAYDLFNRVDAASFRAAWRAATRHAANQLASAMVSRAIHGTATPIFYKGEQVGERRSFDNRLGMWMLNHLAPAQFGAWRDGYVFRTDTADASGVNFQHAMRNLASDLAHDQCALPRKQRPPEQLVRFEDDPAHVEAADKASSDMRAMRRQAETEAWCRRMALIKRGEIDPTEPDSFVRWEAEQARDIAADYASGRDADPLPATTEPEDRELPMTPTPDAPASDTISARGVTPASTAAPAPTSTPAKAGAQDRAADPAARHRPLHDGTPAAAPGPQLRDWNTP